MANWKALNWAERVTAGGPIVRSALDKIALRVNDEFELYSPLARIASLCELTPRRMRDALDKLESKGLITRIRRLRAAGAEGTPLLLLNHPDAPHLNNTPVTLDYKGNHLYPRDPEGLAAVGIRWISGGELNRVHPSHAALTEDGRTLLAPGGTERPPTGRTERPGRGDGASPHGEDGASPLNPPPKISTHPTRAGWLDASPNDQNERARSLLADLEMPHGPAYTPQRAEIEHVAAALAAGVEESRIRSEILDGLGNAVRPAACVKGRCRSLSKLIAPSAAGGGSQGSSAALPEWCGQCEGEPLAQRWRTTATGARVKCSCHPGHPSRQCPAAPSAPSAESLADPAGVLAQLGLTD